MSVDIMATKNPAARRLDVIALAPATPIGEATATISACASNQPSASREARQASQNDDTIHPPPGGGGRNFKYFRTCAGLPWLAAEIGEPY